MSLPAGSTVRDAIEAAGGFGARGMEPHGRIAIRKRRPSDGLYEARRILDSRAHPEHLDVLVLADDLVVVGHDVE